MQALILDSAYETLAVLDTFDSFVWTERYLGKGEFVIEAPLSTSPMDAIKKDNYLYQRDSDYLMIIDEIETTTDAEEGNKVNIKGPSLESILERRIVWQTTNIKDKLQNGIEKLLNENLINPKDTSRKIPNFVFVPSDDPEITKIEIEKQVIRGTNLYSVIYDWCEEYKLGFKIFPGENSGFRFQLYRGTDRSWSQDKLPYVIFSKNYGNLLTSNYYDTNKDYKNVILVETDPYDDESDEPLTMTLYEDSSNQPLGLSRRETYADLYISKRDDNGDTNISEDEYKKLLEKEGQTELSKNKKIEAFEGEIESYDQFVYGVDFFLGDIVQIINEFGMEARSRVTELVFTQDNTGIVILPTFVGIEEEKKE